MGHPYLLSYPARGWTIRGGVNFRSSAREATNPRAALKEWIGLADRIHEAGGEVVVIPPPPTDPPLTGMIYAANHGAWFEHTGEFVVSNMYVSHRKDEAVHIQQFVRGELGWNTSRAEHVWEGQADIATLPGGRFILTWGVRTVREACADVEARLGDDAKTLRVQLRDPYFHGDTCLSMLGEKVLLVFPGALVEPDVDAVRELGVDVLEISEEDALAYACNALCIGERVLMPAGVSDGLQAQLGERGFDVQPIELTELFGKGGGGPRCLVNELRGVQTVPEKVTYAAQREELLALLDDYPESA